MHVIEEPVTEGMVIIHAVIFKKVTPAQACRVYWRSSAGNILPLKITLSLSPCSFTSCWAACIVISIPADHQSGIYVFRRWDQGLKTSALTLLRVPG